MYEVVAGQSSSDKKTLEPGLYGATVQNIYYIGTHDNDYQGTISQQRKIFIELDILDDENEEIHTYYLERTLSLSDKAKLKVDFTEILKKPVANGDSSTKLMSESLGKYCLADIAGYTKKDGSIGAKLSGLKSFNAKKYTAPPLREEPKIYDIDHDNQFPKLPSWVENKIKEAYEYRPEIKFGA